MALTVDQVLALAPDPSAAAAARTLAASRAWSKVGSSAAAVWGLYKGGGLYQVRFARDDLGSQCSCPSRKLPCKHALGLMLVAVARQIPPAEEPDWVREWLDKRTPKAPKPARAEPAAPPDPVARAKRLEKRLERVRGGLDMLDLWTEDLVRDGVASLEERAPSFFGQMAARLVDAQAPGLARRVRRIGFLAGGDPGWPRAVVDELGLLSLASHAFRRIDQIREPLRADLRQLVGFSLDKEEVVATGERVEDTWMLIGQTVTEDERFRSQRTWLRGERTGRYALVLQFAAGAAPFEEMLVAGSRLAATLVFWPSAFPQRALILERAVPEGTAALDLLGFENVGAFLESAADAWAQAPFLERLCCTLRAATPICEENGFVVRDGTGATLPLAGREHWKLLALSGGQPVDLAGEWNGRALFPLATVSEGSFHTLADGGE